MTTREEAIRMAEQAGFDSEQHESDWRLIERLIQLAKNEAYREAYKDCDQRYATEEILIAINRLIKE